MTPPRASLVLTRPFQKLGTLTRWITSSSAVTLNAGAVYVSLTRIDPIYGWLVCG